MAKMIFISYRIYIIARVISKNLNNSSHFLIKMKYVIFQKFYSFSFPYPVAIFLVAACSAADVFWLLFYLLVSPKNRDFFLHYVSSCFQVWENSFQKSHVFSSQAWVIIGPNIKYEPDSY